MAHSTRAQARWRLASPVRTFDILDMTTYRHYYSSQQFRLMAQISTWAPLEFLYSSSRAASLRDHISSPSVHTHTQPLWRSKRPGGIDKASSPAYTSIVSPRRLYPGQWEGTLSYSQLACRMGEEHVLNASRPRKSAGGASRQTYIDCEDSRTSAWALARRSPNVARWTDDVAHRARRGGASAWTSRRIAPYRGGTHGNDARPSCG